MNHLPLSQAVSVSYNNRYINLPNQNCIPLGTVPFGSFVKNGPNGTVPNGIILRR